MRPEDYAGHTPPSESSFEFTPEHDGTLSLESAIYQALGAASMCWERMDGTGVFQSNRAKEIGDALLKKVQAATPDPPAGHGPGFDRPTDDHGRVMVEHMLNREVAEETLLTLRNIMDGIEQFNEKIMGNPMIRNMLGL